MSMYKYVTIGFTTAYRNKVKAFKKIAGEHLGKREKDDGYEFDLVYDFLESVANGSAVSLVDQACTSVTYGRTVTGNNYVSGIIEPLLPFFNDLYERRALDASSKIFLMEVHEDGDEPIYYRLRRIKGKVTPFICYPKWNKMERVGGTHRGGVDSAEWYGTDVRTKEGEVT